MQAQKRPRILVIILLGIFVLLTFSKIIFHEDYTLLRGTDLTQQAYPWFNVAAHWFQKGKLLLWDPFVLSGKPNIGEPQTGMFYPINWMIFTWPLKDGTLPPEALEALIILNFWLMSVFAYLLARSLNIGYLGSFICGIVYSFGGLNSSMHSWLNIQSSFVWFPLVFLFYRKAVLGSEKKTAYINFLWCALFLALSFLAGHHQGPIQAAIFLVLFAIYRKISAHSAENLIPLYQGLILVAVAAALFAAVQILPSAEWGAHAYRWAGEFGPIKGNEKIPHYVLENEDLVYPQDILSLVLPYASLDVNLYIGPAVLLLVLVGAIFHEKTEARFYLLAGILFLFLSFGKYSLIHTWFYTFIPGIWFARESIYFLIPFLLCLALLSGYGFDILCENYSRTANGSIRKFTRRAIELIALIVAAVFVACAIALIQDPNVLPLFDFERANRLMLYLVLTGSVLIFYYGHRINLTFFKILFLGVALLDLGSGISAAIPNKHDPRYRQTNAFDKPQIVHALQEHRSAQLFRVDDTANVLPRNAGDLWFLPTTTGYTTTMNRDYFLLREAGWGPLCNSSALLNIGYFVAPSTLKNPYKLWNDSESGLYYNPRAVPRIYSPKYFRFFSDKERALKFMNSPLFNPHSTAIFMEQDWKKLPQRWQKVFNLQNIQFDLDQLRKERQPSTQVIFSAKSTDKKLRELLAEPWGWRPSDRLQAVFEINKPTNVIILLAFFPGKQNCKIEPAISGVRSTDTRITHFASGNSQMLQTNEIDYGLLDAGKYQFEVVLPQNCDAKLDSIEFVSRQDKNVSNHQFRIKSYQPHEIVIESDLKHPSLLVLSEISYPGWQVNVDALPTAMLRVNYLFRAVAVDTGRHTIEFRFRPASVYWGAIISIVSVIAFLSGAAIFSRAKL